MLGFVQWVIFCYQLMKEIANTDPPTDEDEKPFENYFDKNIFILRTCGLWMPDKSVPAKKRYLQYAYSFLLLIYICLYQPAETAVMFINPTIPKFLRSLRDQFNHFSCIYKLYIWFRYRKLILKLIDTMQDQEYNYDHYGYFDVKPIVQFNKKQADRWMMLFLTFVNLICLNMFFTVFTIFLFFQKEQYQVDEVTGRMVYAQQLAVNLVTPFERESRVSFVMHFLFEIFPLDIYAWMIVGLDCMFTSLMSCVSAHLGILQQAFRTIRPRCMTRMGMEYKELLHDPPELQAEMLKEMKKCIRHLNMLLDVSENLEKIYNLQTFCQVMTSLFEMCFCLYFLSMTLNAEAGPELTYLVSTSFELLLYCWFGNSVTEQSIALTDAIYESDWLSTGKSYKSCMLITMTRLRKPISTTIGKFTPLTFITFLSIARVAYSFFTVLKSDAMGN